MYKNIRTTGLLFVLAGLFSSQIHGMKKEDSKEDSNLTFVKRENDISSFRANWIKADRFLYVCEIQVHLSQKENLNENPTAHFTVLKSGEVIAHVGLDRIAHRLPKTEKKQILKDQCLIHINVVGNNPVKEQLSGLEQILINLKKEIPGLLTIKWCVSDNVTNIPWLTDREWNQYSNNNHLLKEFTLRVYSNDVEEIGEAPVYWVSSMNHYSRRGKKPELLNVVMTGYSTENTFIHYMNKNKRTSAHFTIDKEGKIFHHILLDQAAYFVAPCYGPLEVGQEISFKQIVIGLSGEADSTVTMDQIDFLSKLCEFLAQKYDIQSWTTPLPATSRTAELGSNLLSGINKLEGVHMTQDHRLKKIKSLVYFYPSPKHLERVGEYKDKVDTIVIGHTFCSWDETLMGFSGNDDKAPAYHFTISQDGVIVQHVLIDRKACHSGTSKDIRGREKVNEFSIDIGLVNAGDYQDKYTKKQITALNGLLEDLYRVLGGLYQVTSYEYVTGGRSYAPMGLPWEKLIVPSEVEVVRHTDEEILNREFIN